MNGLIELILCCLTLKLFPYSFGAIGVREGGREKGRQIESDWYVCTTASFKLAHLKSYAHMLVAFSIIHILTIISVIVIFVHHLKLNLIQLFSLYDRPALSTNVRFFFVVSV